MEYLTELGGIGNITAGIILAGVVVAIVTGKLIPERMHDRITTALKDEIGTLQEVRTEYRTQNVQLLENDESILKFLRALDKYAPVPDQEKEGEQT